MIGLLLALGLAVGAAPLDTEQEAALLWQEAWATERPLEEREPAVAELRALHERAFAALEDADEERLRTVVATAFHLNGLPPDLTLEAAERLALLERATEAARRLALPETVANALWRCARLLLALGDVDGARERLEAAAEVLDDAPAMRPWVLLDLGTCSRLAGRWDEALAWLERADAAVDPQRFEVHALARASVHGERFEIWLAWGTPDQARVWLEREREALDLAPDRPEARYVHAIHTIDYALAAEDWGAALEELERCLDSPELLRVSPDAEAKLLLRRALVWNQAGIAAADRTAEIFHEALEHPALRGKDRLLSLLFYAYLEVGLGRLDEAEALLERAREPLAELDVDLVDSAYQRAFFGAVESRIALLRGRPETELAAHLERARSSFDALLAEWSKTPVLPGGIGFLSHGRRRGILSQLFQLELAVNGARAGAERAFEALLAAQDLGSAARAASSRTTLEEVRGELLDEAETLLVYFPAPDVSHLFVVDADTLEHVALPESVALRDAQTKLLRALGSRPRRDADGRVSRGDQRRWRTAAERLADLLLPRAVAERIVPGAAVTVAGFDLRSWFPVECLPLANGDLVGEVAAVAHLPSLPFGLQLARRARTERPIELCLVAAPTHSDAARERWPSSVELPPDDAAYDRIAAPYDARRTRRYTGASATASVLAAAGDAAVLQLVGHGVFDASRLLPAGLVLAPDPRRANDDGVLWHEDAGAAPTAELVVLAACGVGRGPQRRGDEALNHLGGAFLRAGARAVLFAHADLDYEATLRLTARFHDELARAGTSPAEALRRARAALREDPRFDHPHFGALLQVVGLGHRPVFEE